MVSENVYQHYTNSVGSHSSLWWCLGVYNVQHMFLTYTAKKEYGNVRSIGWKDWVRVCDAFSRAGLSWSSRWTTYCNIDYEYPPILTLWLTLSMYKEYTKPRWQYSATTTTNTALNPSPFSRRSWQGNTIHYTRWLSAPAVMFWNCLYILISYRRLYAVGNPAIILGQGMERESWESIGSSRLCHETTSMFTNSVS